MIYELKQGQQGEPLPDAVIVFRLGFPSKDAPNELIANVGHFALSTEDRASELKALSVWAKDLMPPEQACSLMGDRASAYRMALHLNVDEIRVLHLKVELMDYPLDVVWDPHPDPIIQGHSGITGLLQPHGLPDGVRKYKRLRLKLVEMANVEILGR